MGKELITKQQALKYMLLTQALVILFHLSIITQVIPYTIVWAGKLNSVNEMYVFEIISIAINLLLVFLLVLKRNYLKQQVSNKILDVFLWLFVIIFSLNTIGNLMAKTLFEKIAFTSLTFISAVLIWLIVKKEKTNYKN